ncbi:hypothetical protein Ancab_022058 [Ancistrocladus abbreviatus]
MGKYMKKGKITADVAVMEVSQPTSLGVRTRAKTLALQPNPELSYLQLRSRRLEKPQFQPPAPKQKQEKQTLQQQKQSSSPNQTTPPPQQRTSSRLRVSSVNSGSVGSASFSCSKNEEGCFGKLGSKVKRVLVGKEGETEEYGENNLEFDAMESNRSTRESTPCSLIRDLDTVGTPVSAVMPSCSRGASRRSRNASQRSIPTTHEMEEFFADAELQQQRQFIEKYNFDVVNDSPLPGRYEWVRVDP